MFGAGGKAPFLTAAVRGNRCRDAVQRRDAGRASRTPGSSIWYILNLDHELTDSRLRTLDLRHIRRFECRTQCIRVEAFIAHYAELAENRFRLVRRIKSKHFISS